MHFSTPGSYGPNSHLVFRIAFLALVALNMTIVCQGHTEGNLRVGAHLIVLKDPPFVGQVDTTAASQQQQISTSQSPIFAIAVQLPAVSLSHHQRIQFNSSAQPWTVQPLSVPLTTGPSNLLGMASLLPLPTELRLIPVAPASSSAWASHAALGPDVPPPRTQLPVPA